MIKRKPDLTIGPDEAPYLLRWFLLPRNKIFNVYLHKFCQSDDNRALHDHPWLFNVSILLNGSYHEEKPANRKQWPKNLWRVVLKRRRFVPYIRIGKSPHRVKLDVISYHGNGEPIEKPIWTIFITGPRYREWGFYCPQGWRIWTEYTENKPGKSLRGKGCE